MADKNEFNRVDNDTGEAVDTVVGAVSGAAVGSAYGPIGTVVGAITGGVMGNNLVEGADEANDGDANRED
ncbi:glycine zipper 2TM domain-containing protein [Bacillus salipaludis]|uniref:Blp family class II bacteriocin n=1 Tax=Bacillus salipaludis TaxID=2547811 RepID=A0AA90TWE8_9BACI|nr:Blp family class II bacteriocin [Bacillus salipaludis]MDQ6600721.1 Blp family class II bacteriocin [Bacillus salipaludis]